MDKYNVAKIGKGIGIAGVVASFIYVTNPKVDNPQEKYFITESPAVAEYFSTVETLKTLDHKTTGAKASEVQSNLQLPPQSIPVSSEFFFPSVQVGVL